MKKILVLFYIFFPFLSGAQDVIDGVNFRNNLTWSKIKEQAKVEKKYIFVDCYATWCGPCKMMDDKVFLSNKIGNYINRNFIAIKVQLDTSKNDSEYVKDWYPDANYFCRQYNIHQLPTFLIFSPDGKLVHKGIGYKSENDFFDFLAQSLDSTKQYYTLLEKYKNGSKDFSKMAYLAMTAKGFNDDKVADIVAKDYKVSYLDRLQEKELCTIDNLKFICSGFYQLVNSKDGFFNLFYRHASEVNAMMNDNGLAGRFVDYVINKEEIDSRIWNKGIPIILQPNWDIIRKNIELKYNIGYAVRLVLQAQLNFYNSTKNWDKYVFYIDKKIKEFPPKPGAGLTSDQWELNGRAWDIFQNSNNKHHLLRAVNWINLSIKLDTAGNHYPNVQIIDTKANILYKLGRRTEAVSLEEKAAALDPNFEEIQNNLSKMKKGLPTWNNKGR